MTAWRRFAWLPILAIGARRTQIVVQFLIEALVLSVFGGLVGMALGVGIGFGIYPAIRASRLDPIVALRYE